MYGEGSCAVSASLGPGPSEKVNVTLKRLQRLTMRGWGRIVLRRFYGLRCVFDVVSSSVMRAGGDLRSILAPARSLRREWGWVATLVTAVGKMMS